MARHNNRTRTEPKPINIRGFQASVEDDHAPITSLAKLLAVRNAVLEQYGDRGQRAPYLAASLGRSASQNSSQLLAYPFRKISSLAVHENSGMVYVPGSNLAGITHYGMKDPDNGRLTPEQNVADIVTELRSTSTLAPSAEEELSVRVKSIVATKWGKFAVKIIAKLSDVPTHEYLTTGQILGEKIAARTVLGGAIPNPNLSLQHVEHSLLIATADRSALPAVTAVIATEGLEPGTPIQLTGIGFVNDPLPNHISYA